MELDLIIKASCRLCKGEWIVKLLMLNTQIWAPGEFASSGFSECLIGKLSYSKPRRSVRCGAIRPWKILECSESKHRGLVSEEKPYECSSLSDEYILLAVYSVQGCIWEVNPLLVILMNFFEEICHSLCSLFSVIRIQMEAWLTIYNDLCRPARQTCHEHVSHRKIWISLTGNFGSILKLSMSFMQNGRHIDMILLLDLAWRDVHRWTV